MGAMTGNTALLVLGMHRSGTSAVTRVLNLLGAALPNRLVPPGPGNVLGHWEPVELVALHETMLEAAGSHVYGLFDIAPEWFGSAAAVAFARELAALIRRNYAEAPLIVVKDPRLALLVPVWQQALALLNITPRYVLPFRDPRAVAASLRRRESRHEGAALWPPERGMLLWLRYVLAAERATRGSPRAFLSFDALLADWPAELARLALQLGLSWPRGEAEMGREITAFLNRRERHEAVSRLDAWPDTVLPQIPEVYRALATAVAVPESGRRVFDAAAVPLAAGADMMRVYVDALEAEVRRLRPVQYQVEAVLGSRSWRLTAPLRALRRLLPQAPPPAPGQRMPDQRMPDIAVPAPIPHDAAPQPAH